MNPSRPNSNCFQVSCGVVLKRFRGPTHLLGRSAKILQSHQNFLYYEKAVFLVQIFLGTITGQLLYIVWLGIETTSTR